MSEAAMIVGGVILLVSALMLVWGLLKTHGSMQPVDDPEVVYADSLHPVARMPRLMNGFAFWNLILLVYMVASYGYPILQFFLMETHGTTPWSI
jgi:cytochrome c oxidase subunit 1